MKVAVFSTKEYDRHFLDEANQGSFDLLYYDTRLDLSTARLAEKIPVVCTFVNDRLDSEVLLRLFAGGTRMLALRCAGFNNVDMSTVKNLGMRVARVPSYSPRSISEFTIGLILALARKICKAYLRTREGNFSLEGLLGFNICDRTVGIIGTGKIGAQVAQGLKGLGCTVYAYDLYENRDLAALGIRYVSLEELFRSSDIISLHCPLTPENHHLVNERTISQMRDGVMIINTSRGALIDTESAIRALKSGKIGSMALDVYEEEADFFFEDYSDRVIQDDHLARLLRFPNVIITGHQAFFTVEAMRSIARQTIDNIRDFEQGKLGGAGSD
ncbi:MAG: 2-hydroxyacid dehydrogenase [Planctomycetia bacterium]|nr:2-hydroxyacid dehydrogenase [Planctomycetia bacterium]